MYYALFQSFEIYWDLFIAHKIVYLGTVTCTLEKNEYSVVIGDSIL